MKSTVIRALPAGLFIAGLGLSPMALAGQAVLEEVVVTAQKRQEAYTDVPVAVATVSGEMLEMAKVVDFQDIVQVSPSVTYTQSNGMRGSGILIRGIGTTAFQTGVEPTVSVVTDGVTLGRTLQFLTDLDDIERIEVLRGPQGTLFGKNASGGLINVVTKRPSDQFEAKVQMRASDDDSFGLTAMVSGPLNDRVRGRFSAFSQQFDGFIKNVSTGETVNGDDSKGARGKLEIDLTDTSNLLLIADYTTQERNCCISVPVLAGRSPFYAFDWQALEIDDDNDESIGGRDSYSDFDTWGLSAEYTLDIGNTTFTSITAYRESTQDTQQETDLLPYTEPTFGRFLITRNGTPPGEQEQTQFSQEFRINSSWDTLNVTAGLFFWDQSIERFFLREAIFCLAPGAGSGMDPDPAVTPCLASLRPNGSTTSTTDNVNWAGFGQVDWRFADRWTASLGLRYTEDDLEFDLVRVSPQPGPFVQPSVTLANSNKDSDISGKLALMWDVTDNAMLYTSYSEGYKAPAFDIVFGSSAANVMEAVAPEESEAWEIGLKSELLDRRLRLGVTAFHTRFDGLQGQSLNQNTLSFQLTSAGTAITRGLEIDFAAKPTANILLGGGVAYVDAYYDDYDIFQCYPGQTAAEGCVGGFQDLGGADIVNSPDYKVTLQGRWDIPMGNVYGLFLSANWRWQSDRVGATNQDPRLDLDSYAVLDLTVGAESSDGRWSVEVFAKNALDEHYVDTLQDFNTLNPGAVVALQARDAYRYVGAQFQYRFGGF